MKSFPQVLAFINSNTNYNMPGSASANPWATELKTNKAKRQTSNVSSLSGTTEASFKSAATGNGNGSTGNGGKAECARESESDLAGANPEISGASATPAETEAMDATTEPSTKTLIKKTPAKTRVVKKKVVPKDRVAENKSENDKAEGGKKPGGG